MTQVSPMGFATQVQFKPGQEEFVIPPSDEELELSGEENGDNSKIYFNILSSWYILDLDFIGLLKWTNRGKDHWLQRSLT